MKNNAIINNTDKVQRVLEIMNLTDSQTQKYISALKFTPNVFVLGIEYGRDQKRAVLWCKHDAVYNHGLDSDRKRSSYYEYLENTIAWMVKDYFDSINKKVPKYERILEIYVGEKGTYNEYWKGGEDGGNVIKNNKSPFVGDSVPQRSRAVKPLGLGAMNNNTPKFSFPKFNLGDYAKIIKRVNKGEVLNEVGIIGDIYWSKNEGWKYLFSVDSDEGYEFKNSENEDFEDDKSIVIEEARLQKMNKRNFLGIKANFYNSYIMFEANEPISKDKAQSKTKGKPQVYQIIDNKKDSLKIVKVKTENGKLVGYGDALVVKLPHQFIRTVPIDLAKFICGGIENKPEPKVAKNTPKFSFPLYQRGDMVDAKIKGIHYEGVITGLEWKNSFWEYDFYGKPSDIKKRIWFASIKISESELRKIRVNSSLKDENPQFKIGDYCAMEDNKLDVFAKNTGNTPSVYEIVWVSSQYEAIQFKKVVFSKKEEKYVLDKEEFNEKIRTTNLKVIGDSAGLILLEEAKNEKLKKNSSSQSSNFPFPTFEIGDLVKLVLEGDMPVQVGDQGYIEDIFWNENDGFTYLASFKDEQSDDKYERIEWELYDNHLEKINQPTFMPFSEQYIVDSYIIFEKNEPLNDDGHKSSYGTIPKVYQVVNREFHTFQPKKTKKNHLELSWVNYDEVADKLTRFPVYEEIALPYDKMWVIPATLAKVLIQAETQWIRLNGGLEFALKFRMPEISNEPKVQNSDSEFRNRANERVAKFYKQTKTLTMYVQKNVMETVHCVTATHAKIQIENTGIKQILEVIN